MTPPAALTPGALDELAKLDAAVDRGPYFVDDSAVSSRLCSVHDAADECFAHDCTVVDAEGRKRLLHWRPLTRLVVALLNAAPVLIASARELERVKEAHRKSVDLWNEGDENLRRVVAERTAERDRLLADLAKAREELETVREQVNAANRIVRDDWNEMKSLRTQTGRGEHRQRARRAREG